MAEQLLASEAPSGDEDGGDDDDGR
jgi:hypothetical protein